MDNAPERVSHVGPMTEVEQEERRRAILTITRDPSLSQKEKSSRIQSLMDGRGDKHRCSESGPFYGSIMAQVAVEAMHSKSSLLMHCDATAKPNAMSKLEQLDRLMEQSRPTCGHYERNCSIVSPCCGLVFACRICHDESAVLPPPIGKRRASNETSVTEPPKSERRCSLPLECTASFNNEAHHPIDRFAIQEVICRHCYIRQSSKTNKCIQCDIQFGQFHCNICNLWMSKDQEPYHCAQCGFCRVGGRDNFRHCTDCGMCIDTLLFDDHNCKSGNYMSNCPICQEDLFSSRYASLDMPCGHMIHWHCFNELKSYDARCPVCKKTAESPEHMEAAWTVMAMSIALQPVPPEMARAVNILCIDCETTDTCQRWHFLGVRCRYCRSFNTIVEQVVMQGYEAAAYLDRMEQNEPSRNGIPIQDMALSSSAGFRIAPDGEVINDDCIDDTSETSEDMEERPNADISDRMNV